MSQDVLVDASVARSFAVLGWVGPLIQVLGGTLFVAHGVLGVHPDEPCELLGIREALEREAVTSGLGSGRASKAIAACGGLDALLNLGPPRVRVLLPEQDEIQLATKLMSMEPTNREWRRSLGLKARRLDAGESVSIAISSARRRQFASDDGQAILAFEAITGRAAARTLDLVKRVVSIGLIGEQEARGGYRFLQEDDLHLLGGPDW